MNTKYKKENIILMGTLVVFVFFVTYMVFRQANQGSGSSLDRNQAISFFSGKINEIAPEKPSLGGTWHIIRFRFTGDNNVYVEYEDGHNARAFLLTIDSSVGATPNYRIIGFFEPGQLEYKILAGENPYKGQPQDIYEFNETAQKWVKVN